MAIPTNRSPTMRENTMPSSRMFENKICLVTGGASGIGRAVVKMLAAEGAEGIAIADIDVGAAREIAEVCRSTPFLCGRTSLRSVISTMLSPKCWNVGDAWIAPPT